MRRFLVSSTVFITGACSSRVELGEAAPSDGTRVPAPGPVMTASGGARPGAAGGESAGTGATTGYDVSTGGRIGGHHLVRANVETEAVSPPGFVSKECPSIVTAPGHFNPCGSTFGLAYSPDGRFLAAAMQTPPPNVHVWRLSDGAYLRAFHGMSSRSFAVAFSPNSRVLAVAGENVDDQADAMVRLYDVELGVELEAIRAPFDYYSSEVAFSNDGTTIAFGGYTPPIEIWRVAGGPVVSVRPEVLPNAFGSVRSLHFAPQGSRLLAAGSSGKATIFDIPSGAPLLTLAPPSPVYSDGGEASFSPDGAQIASTWSEGEGPVLVAIWDAANGALLQKLDSHARVVSRVLWVDRDHLVSNDWSGVVKTWARRSGSFAASGEWSSEGQSLGLAVAPDGKSFVASGWQEGLGGFVFLPADLQRLAATEQ